MSSSISNIEILEEDGTAILEEDGEAIFEEGTYIVFDSPFSPSITIPISNLQIDSDLLSETIKFLSEGISLPINVISINANIPSVSTNISQTLFQQALQFQSVGISEEIQTLVNSISIPNSGLGILLDLLSIDENIPTSNTSISPETLSIVASALNITSKTEVSILSTVLSTLELEINITPNILSSNANFPNVSQSLEQTLLSSAITLNDNGISITPELLSQTLSFPQSIILGDVFVNVDILSLSLSLLKASNTIGLGVLSGALSTYAPNIAVSSDIIQLSETLPNINIGNLVNTIILSVSALDVHERNMLRDILQLQLGVGVTDIAAATPKLDLETQQHGITSVITTDKLSLNHVINRISALIKLANVLSISHEFNSVSTSVEQTILTESVVPLDTLISVAAERLSLSLGHNDTSVTISQDTLSLIITAYDAIAHQIATAQLLSLSSSFNDIGLTAEVETLTESLSFLGVEILQTFNVDDSRIYKVRARDNIYYVPVRRNVFKV